MSTANQISIGVILGILANAAYWWVLKPLWHRLIDRLMPVREQPTHLGGMIVNLHLYGVVEDIGGE